MSANIKLNGASASERPSENIVARTMGTGRKIMARLKGGPSTSMMSASGTSEMSRFTMPAITVASTKMLFGTYIFLMSGAYPSRQLVDHEVACAKKFQRTKAERK